MQLRVRIRARVPTFLCLSAYERPAGTAHAHGLAPGFAGIYQVNAIVARAVQRPVRNPPAVGSLLGDELFQESVSLFGCALRVYWVQREPHVSATLPGADRKGHNL